MELFKAKYLNLFKEECDVMVFEIGKYYKHTCGSVLHICGCAETHVFGWTLIGDNKTGELIPIGSGESHAVNYVEIKKDEFLNNDWKPHVTNLSGEKMTILSLHTKDDMDERLKSTNRKES
jgi:hypothetical protein